MKRFMQIFATCVAVVLLSVVSSLGVYHYKSQDSGFTEKGTAVNVQLQEAIEQVTNPVMLSVDDVMQFKQRVTEEHTYDSVFRMIPDDVLQNVAQVVIGRQHGANMRDLVDEFRRNYKNVYQYIKCSETAPQSDTSSIPKAPSVKTVADTIIDGKAFRLIKSTEGRIE